MNKYIIVCNTHYQLLVAVQLKLSVLNKFIVDCVVTDYISNCVTIANKLRQLHVFNQIFVEHVKGIKFDGTPKMFSDAKFLNYMSEEMQQFLKRSCNYDGLYFANLGEFGPRLGRYMKHRNPKLEISIYEDGLSSYSRIYESRVHEIVEPHGIKGKLRKYFALNPVAQMNTYYLFCPKLMVWSCPQVRKIPPINENIEELRKIANHIYSYDEIRDKYSEKVIFFEESYFQDGIQVDDVLLVESLAKKYGKDNIFVKTHPRNETNRFKELGYKTNVDKSVPWEVIALNLDLNDKILVTMTSSTIANTCIMRPSRAQLIYDYRHMNLEANTRLKYTVEVIEKMKKIFPELIIMED